MGKLQDFKPMLAESIDPDKLSSLFDGTEYAASVKYDGVRCLVTGKGILGRSLKAIRNTQIQKKFERLPYGLDGELVLVGVNTVLSATPVQSIYKVAPVQLTTGFVNSIDAKEDTGDYKGYKIALLVFDHFADSLLPFKKRYRSAINAVSYAYLDIFCTDVAVIDQFFFYNLGAYQEWVELYASCDSAEGAILKAANNSYKFGRSTFKSRHMLRDVKVETSEATLVELEPRLKNLNESTINELGYKEKRNTKDDKRALEMVGALVVDHPTYGRFKIGTGFDVALASKMWANQEEYIGKLVTFSYKAFGLKDKPRQPVFKAFRDASELEENTVSLGGLLDA